MVVLDAEGVRGSNPLPPTKDLVSGNISRAGARLTSPQSRTIKNSSAIGLELGTQRRDRSAESLLCKG